MAARKKRDALGMLIFPLMVAFKRPGRGGPSGPAPSVKSPRPPGTPSGFLGGSALLADAVHHVLEELVELQPRPVVELGLVGAGGVEEVQLEVRDLARLARRALGQAQRVAQR